MHPELIKAMAQCNPDEALPAEDPRYVDLDRIRGISVHRNILKKLATADHECYCHVALAGHRGSGKSTELNRLIAQAQLDGFHPLYAEVTERADPAVCVCARLRGLALGDVSDGAGGAERGIGLGVDFRDESA